MELHTLAADDGTVLRYGLAGPADGLAVLLCHGLGAGGEQFAADALWLAERGYRVIVPDLRGHGGSGMPSEVTAGAFALDRLAQDQICLLDHLGVEQVHWVGNSLGGIIGLHLATTHPERLASLALFGTALALDLPAWTARLMPVLDRVPGRAAMARMTAWSTTHNRAARPVIEASLRQYDASAAALVIGHICHYDLRAAALGWSGPGLVLVGGRDYAVNRALHGQLAPLHARPNWHILDLPEGGHCANLDAGDGWRAALLSFWSAPQP